MIGPAHGAGTRAPAPSPFPAFRRLAGPFVLAPFLFLLSGCLPEVEGDPEAQVEFASFASEYLDWHYESNPVRATGLGIHAYDHRLDDVSREGIRETVEELREWLERLEGISRDGLTGPAYPDHRVLEYAIRAELLELEEVRGWRADPRSYVSLVSRGVSSLADREFAPLEERIRSILARQAEIPRVLRAARENLEEVPELFAEHAVRNARGAASYFRDDLPRALEAQGLSGVETELRDQLRASTEEAADRMDAFADWLETDLLPRADGDFRLGRDLFERTVRYNEHVDLDAEELDALNEAAIRQYREWVAEVAREIDPDRPPGEVMDSITRLHPSPDELIPTAREYQDDLQAFILEHGIVTLPTDAQPVVRETPPYARSGFASMSTPGPFETEATEAYYNITNVLPEWTPEEQEQHLTYFNHAGLLGITIHESFPGHFVQLLYRPRIPTDVRKVFQPSSLVEGWAHYAEQMMLDETFGDGDPVLRMGQLRRALQRHARWYAGLHMHAFGESLEDAVERNQEIAHFDYFPALREVERGAWNPTYLYYALGRMQIFQLRDDYRAHVEARGEEFSLQDFHDEFLRQGLPVALARESMIPGVEGPSLEVPGPEGGRVVWR